MQYDLEIVIPVFHEEGNILKTLNNILEKVKLNYRIIVVYDYTEDPTLKVIKDNFQTEKIFFDPEIGFIFSNFQCIDFNEKLAPPIKN